MQDFNYAPPVIDTAISDKYDPTATYAVGDLVIHEDRLYKCTTAISTAETWTAAHWTETSIDTEIGSVRSAIPEVVNALNDTSIGKALSAAQGKVLKDTTDTLNSKLSVINYTYPQVTVSQLKTNLISQASSMGVGESKQLTFVCSNASGVIRSNDNYSGIISKIANNFFHVCVTDGWALETVVLNYQNGTWSEYLQGSSSVNAGTLNDQIANNYTHYTLFASSNLELVNDASITLTDDRRNYRELVFIYRYSATGTFYERHFYWEDASYITLDTIFGNSCWAYISRVDYTHFKVSGGSATNRPFLTKIYGIK